MIKSLNLVLSNRCTATCAYCPAERGRSDPGLMSIALVRKLAEEAGADSFPWKVTTVQLGENGDALLHPQFDAIVACIRLHLKAAKICLTTNLINMREHQFCGIIQSHALDSIDLNIDGHDATTYEAQKGLPYDRVMANLKLLLEYRAQFQPDLRVCINVLPLSHYRDKVMARFGRPPERLSEKVPHSSFAQVRDSLHALGVPSDVAIRKSPVFFWAERNLPVERDRAKCQCPQLPRVEREAFISPSGLWYPCCLDSNHDQALGDVSKRSLRGVHDSPERALFLKRLRAGRFDEIGYPCSRVQFCGATK